MRGAFVHCSGNKQSLRSVMTLCMREIGQYWVHAGRFYRGLLPSEISTTRLPGQLSGDRRSRLALREKLERSGGEKIEERIVMIHRDEDLEMLDFTWR